MLPPLGLASVLPLSPHSDRWCPISKRCSVKLMFSSFPYLPPYLGLRAEYSRRNGQSIRCQAVLADIHIFDKNLF